jgi:S1-C subfamily serine protease
MTFAVAHMVTGAQALTALVAGRVVNAHLIGDDPVSDVAVVKLDGSEFPPAPLGTALGVRVGDPVTAMSPSDSDEGLVSALSKTGLLQVTTDRDGDMPGTPVLDRDGAVIALAAAGAGSKAETATPMDWAKEVAAELISSGHAVPVWLGVQGHDLAPSAAAAIGVGGGAVIDNVLAASPASTAGVRAGDVVLGVDGRAVRSFAHLLMAVHALPVGSPLQLDVRRGATDWTIDTVLTARPPDA